jgi:hypothetical protein
MIVTMAAPLCAILRTSGSTSGRVPPRGVTRCG